MSKKDSLPSLQSTNPIFKDIRQLIEQSRQQVALAINSAMSMLYWQIGKRINDEILQNQRAEYGEQIVQSLSAQLIIEFGKGFSKRNLLYMMQFAKVFPE